MKITKKEDYFEVEGSRPGALYKVSLKQNSCTCPHFRFRLKGQGECKHITAVRDHVGVPGYDDIIGFVEEQVFVDSIELIEKFGEDAVDRLISEGELVEDGGKVRLL